MNSFIVPPQKAVKKDGLFLFLTFAVSFVFFQFLFFNFGSNLGFGVPIYFGLLHLCAALYLKGSRIVFSKLSIITFIPVLILMLSFFLYNNSELWFLNLVALWFASSVNLLVMGGLLEYPFKKSIIVDVFKATFYLPFEKIGERINSFSFKKTCAKKLLFIFLTLLVISPAVAIVLVLLSSADNNFGSLIEKAAQVFGDEVMEYLFKTILALLLAFPLFNLLYKLKNNVPIVKAAIKAPADTRKLDPVCPAAALSVFSLIYIFYISLQAGYLFSALFGVLPKDFTYAVYARRGFFELSAVVFFNLFVMALVFIFTKRKGEKLPTIINLLSALMVLCTVLLTVTALSKMALYINAYGLTPLRVYTSWFMLLLLILSIYLFIKIFAPKFKLSKYAACTAIVMYLILNIANTDAFIARYNIDRYRNTGKLDSTLLFNLSDSAVPVIDELKDDTQHGYDVRLSYKFRKENFENSDFSNRNLSSYIAYYFYLNK